MVYILVFTSVLIGVLGQLLMKQGVSSLGQYSDGLVQYFIKAALSPWIIGGIFAYVVGTAFWLLILSKVDVSFAYPMLSLGYVFLLIFASFFLGEHISVIRYAGVLLIIIGVILITRS